MAAWCYQCPCGMCQPHDDSEVLWSLIYETNVRPKIGRTVVSAQNLEFINMDMSGGYDQISRQV